MTYDLPEGLISRFKTLTLERLGRIDQTWTAAVSGHRDPTAIRDMRRDLHTIRGDARMVGFDEVHTLAEKLEELVEAGERQDFRISEDLEFVVTMAFQFAGMILRKKSSTALTGIDLPSFLRQVDEVVHESHTMLAPARKLAIASDEAPEPAIERLSEATQHRLAVAATGVYLEYLGARRGPSRDRLRGVWMTMRDELARIQAVPLARTLGRHAEIAHSIAAELGKQIIIDLDVGNARVDARLAEALDVAAVHLIRNAIDHGIETPGERLARGKPLLGEIRISAREDRGAMRVEIADDGDGIDLDVVRERAIRHGLLSAERGTTVTEAELLDCLFQSGFTTRTSVTQISGRGVGLDAVRGAIARAGGTVAVSSHYGRGATFTLEAPTSIRQKRMYRFLGVGGAVAFGVSASWTPTVEPMSKAAMDPFAVIPIAATSQQTMIDPPAAPRELAVRLRWGMLEVVLRAASEPELVTAERICPTPDDHPIEIVTVDKQETILLRPELLAALVEH